MSETNGIERPASAGAKNLKHFGGWVLTTGAVAGTYFVADSNFSSEVENTLLILGSGAALSMLSLWTGLRSPLILVRYSRNAIAFAVRAARKRKETASEDTPEAQ